jgi:radical SAM protein with 4Fe4S-binding SPASM domain
MRGVHDLVDFIGGCGFGRVYAALEPDGMLKPCVFTDRVIGDLRKDDITRIWRESKLIRLARDRKRLKGACGKCENKYICGGCRARALGYLNDPLAPDPGCIKNESYWKKIVWT